MADKISDRLASLLSRAPDRTPVSVQVMLRRDLDEQQLATSLKSLNKLLIGAEYIPLSGTVHGSLPLSEIPAVSSIPFVESVDLESHAAIEELMDSA